MSTELWLSHGNELAPQAELQRRIWDELRWEPLLDDAAITVEVADSAATLAGTVSSHPAKVAAGRAVSRVSGVRSLKNVIEVALPPSRVRSDSDLAHAVARALEWDVRVPHEEISVQVADGRVTLTGDVRRDFERGAAGDAVACLAGVRNVVNLITVKAVLPAGDLTRRVEAALEHDPLTHGRHIRAEARGDAVVLRGRVWSLAEREQLEHAVRAVPGVRTVENDLDVGR